MKSKSIFLAGAAIVGIPVGAAMASDMPMPVKMPVKAAPIVAPPFNWTGFYVGVNAGVLFGRSVQTVDLDTFGGVPADTSSFSGFIAGVQGGYNWQLSNIVLGVEADFDFSSAKKSVVTGPFDTHNMSVKSIGTARGRLGLVYDRWLPYITGGAAWANLTNQIVDTTVPFTADRGSSATGWTVGGGLEYGFDNHWSAKAEYLYVKFPDKTVALAAGGYNFQFTFKDTEQLARVGINYRF